MVHIKKHAKGYQLFSKFNNMPMGPIRKSHQDVQLKDMRRFETFSKKSSNLSARPSGVRRKGKIKFDPSASNQMKKPGSTALNVPESTKSTRKKPVDSMGSERIGGKAGNQFLKSTRPKPLHSGFVGMGGSSSRSRGALV